MKYGREALRLYLGLNGDVMPKKAFCRIVQLEKRADEMNKQIREIKQSVLEKLDSEISKLLEELDKLDQELTILKQAYMKKRTKGKTDDKVLIGIIKKAFEDIERDPTILKFVDDPKRAIRARLKAIAKQTNKKLHEIEALAKELVPVVRSVLTDNPSLE